MAALLTRTSSAPHFSNNLALSNLHSNLHVRGEQVCIQCLIPTWMCNLHISPIGTTILDLRNTTRTNRHNRCPSGCTKIYACMVFLTATKRIPSHAKMRAYFGFSMHRLAPTIARIARISQGYTTHTCQCIESKLIFSTLRSHAMGIVRTAFITLGNAHHGNMIQSHFFCLTIGEHSVH